AWDITAGQVTALTPQTDPPTVAGLPLALTYKWTADGRVVADQAAPHAAPGTFTGSPAHRSDGTFSRWQPGTIRAISGINKDETPTPQKAWMYEAEVSDQDSWSPNGRYLHLGVRTAIRLPAPSGVPALGPSNYCGDFSFETSVCAQSPAQLPDRAFAAV